MEKKWLGLTSVNSDYNSADDHTGYQGRVRVLARISGEEHDGASQGSDEVIAQKCPLSEYKHSLDADSREPLLIYQRHWDS